MDTILGGRVERSRRTLLLAAGDAAMIAAFVALGELRHAGTLAAGLETFAQFGLGWLLAGTLAGVYAPGAVDSARRAVVQGVAAWVLAALVGQLVRVLMRPGTFVLPSFVLVSVGAGGLLIGLWRFVAARQLE
ncbi:MAG: DUF3054 domain-containing protein [Halobacteriales archaeon]